MSGSSKTGKGKNPKGLNLDASPSSTPSRGHADGTLIFKGKAFYCYMEDFKFLYKLGYTLSGRLDLMIHEPTGHIMTVQILDVSSTNERMMFLNAVNDFVVRIVDWSHIITIYGIMAKKEKVWICMEPMRATISRLFNKLGGRRIPEEVLREMAIAVLRALNNLQILSIPHESVWLSNILMDGKANFKFCYAPETYGFFGDHTELQIENLRRFLVWSATGTAQSILPADEPCSDEFRDFVAQCKSQQTPSYALLLEHAFIKQSNEQSRFDSKRWVIAALQELEQHQKIPVIPPEITVRGRLALEAYKKALDEGKTCDKRVPVMLIGQDRSGGKTSLKKSLRGEPFNPVEESTLGIDFDPSHFKLSTETWKIGKKEQERNSETSISYEYHAARATVENLKKEKKGPSPEEGVPETKQSGSIPVVDQVATPVSLHFWPESQFCGVEKVVCCTKSAAAKISRVDFKKFAPWLAPLGNQLTVDKHNGGNLGNVQESSRKRTEESPLPSPKCPKVMPEHRAESSRKRTKESPRRSSKCRKVTPEHRAAVKEGIPVNDDLEGLANEIIEWKKLGRRLLENADAMLDAIDKRNEEENEKAYKMLSRWKQAEGSCATFRVLHDALCHDFVNRRDLAEKYCKV